MLDGWGAHARNTSHTRSPFRPTLPHSTQVDDNASSDDIKAAYRYPRQSVPPPTCTRTGTTCACC